MANPQSPVRTHNRQAAASRSKVAKPLAGAKKVSRATKKSGAKRDWREIDRRLVAKGEAQFRAMLESAEIEYHDGFELWHLPASDGQPGATMKLVLPPGHSTNRAQDEKTNRPRAGQRGARTQTAQ